MYSSIIKKLKKKKKKKKLKHVKNQEAQNYVAKINTSKVMQPARYDFSN